MTLQNLYRAQVSDLKSKLQNFSLGESKYVKISNLPAVDFTYNYSANNSTLKSGMILTAKADKLYQIVFDSTPKKFNSSLSVIDKILSHIIISENNSERFLIDE